MSYSISDAVRENTEYVHDLAKIAEKYPDAHKRASKFGSIWVSDQGVVVDHIDVVGGNDNPLFVVSDHSLGISVCPTYCTASPNMLFADMREKDPELYGRLVQFVAQNAARRSGL